MTGIEIIPHAGRVVIELDLCYHEWMIYFTNVGGPGRVMFGQVPRSIAVLDRIRSGNPIGVALATGQTDEGFALWSLQIDDAELAGQWIIIDREFVAAPADPD
jgi:hypothetical protein